MVTLEEAKRIAAEWLDDISACTEFTTAWVFTNPRSAESDGGWDSPVVVLKESGRRCGFPEFIHTYGGGRRIREIRF